MAKKKYVGSQRQDVLAVLKTEGKITSMDAIRRFGATRLSSIIFNLRKEGYEIRTVMKTGEDRYGHTVNYGVYYLEDKI